MGNVEDMDKNEIAKIGKGLSHPTRVEILNILRNESGGMFLIDIVKLISKKNDYKSEFTSIKSHVLELVYAGLVELTKREGKFYVILIRDVEIEVREVLNHDPHHDKHHPNHRIE